MNKWLLLASLYVAQFLPVAFFGQTIPVFLRQQGVLMKNPFHSGRLCRFF
ncbi:MAG: hypothetical protein HC939_21510 [Pleurocapsa sp. SU_5_0]|nr:hypothetical protein [Pleurocapsa sp. SU_5_0]NJO96305.1 hypothetical protein [Pleurocapsa sp. CRU_1_2]NJR46039.1 hypothetical protein [Hyellaceae cyanobacterium CSU_1_1]